jgi:predicted transposase YdaD
MTASGDSINNPHDRFTRRVLGDIDNVRALIEWRMPDRVLAVLRLDTIRPASQSFVDELLRVGLSDLVFEIGLAGGNEAYVVFLFEHKSSPDRMTPFQVLRYIVQINEQRVRLGEPLCCVIPLVLYHGPESWNTSRTMRELVGAPSELEDYVPEFGLPLADLSVCSDEELRQESLFLAYMSLLKYIMRDELPERLPEILGVFRRMLPPATAFESLVTILRYLVGQRHFALLAII